MPELKVRHELRLTVSHKQALMERAAKEGKAVNEIIAEWTEEKLAKELKKIRKESK